MAIEADSQRIGTNHALKQSFRFAVSIGESNAGAPPNYSVATARFSRISRIRGGVNTIQAPNGGTGPPEKFPTSLRFQDITLERGQTNKLDLMEWFNEVALAGAGIQAGGRYKRTVTISDLDREGFAIHRMVFHDAFPTEYVVGPYDANSSAFLILRLRLAFRAFSVQNPSSSRTPARPGADILDVFAVREDERQSRFRQVEPAE